MQWSGQFNSIHRANGPREVAAPRAFRSGSAELRGALHLTQKELADRLSVAQSNISRLEHRRDMLISTLQEVVRALGGELRLSAVFPDIVVEINQFLEESSRE